MKKNKKTEMMAGVLMIVFVGAFLVVLGRFLYIQVTGEVNNVSLTAWAEQKRTSSYTLEAQRGKILDSNGMPLATDRVTYQLYAIIDETHSQFSSEPLHVTDFQETAKKLAPILGVDESFIIDQFEKGKKDNRFQVEFGSAGKYLSQQKKDEIHDLHLPGINFEKVPIRYYPNGEFASQIIGFARKDENEIIGVTGIEKEKDELLRGKNGYVSYQRDKFNKKLLDANEIVKKPTNGDDIYLTIDQKIQTLLEDAMTEVEKEYTPKRATAIVMNAKTGEILAMSTRPGYNPNNPENVENWYNDAISTPVESGSTMKIFTWAAAIDAGVYNGGEWYKSGSYKINERIQKINDHNGGRGWGTITFNEGFARSSNVAASKLVWEKIGPERFLEYLKSFDFDKETGIDLPGEVPGKILYNWPLEKITTGFGQGSTQTPIQQMKAATAITNDGKMLQPYVIKKVVDPDSGKVLQENEPNIVGEPIKAETSKKVLDLMELVVNSEDGTGQMYKLDDYTVAGKTGTAEIPNPTGSYLTGRENYIFSFLGAAPKEDPQLIMYVSVQQPNLEYDELGSAPVSFIFKNVMETSLHYLNIEPDKETNGELKPVKTPKFIDQSVEEVKDQLSKNELQGTFIGDGDTVVKASVQEGEQVLPNDRIILVTNKPTMPNIIGWSLRDAHLLADLLELNMESIGNGFVITQNIEEGTPLKKGTYLGIELEVNNKTEDQESENEATDETEHHAEDES